MIINVDLELLNAQIKECDIKANNASSEEEREVFDGIANLLSSIAYAIEHGYEVDFEMEVE